MEIRNRYVLNENGSPIVEPDFMKWAEWFEKADRHVADEKVGNVRVSTVFLGLNHNFSQDGSPILWETMVFGGKLDQEQDRCSGSKEQAEAMHAKMVERVKAVEA